MAAAPISDINQQFTDAAVKKAALLLFGISICCASAILYISIGSHPVSISVPELKSLLARARRIHTSPQRMFITDTDDEYNDFGRNKIGDTVFMIPNYDAKLIGRIAHPATTFAFDEDPKLLVKEVSALLKGQKGWSVKPFDAETLFADKSDAEGNQTLEFVVKDNSYSKHSEIYVLDWSQRIPDWRMRIYDYFHV